MLNGLDSIPWQKYEHAYGEASGVPAWIRGLNDPKRRDASLGQLGATIYHQGTIYEATVHAVPFLVELLEHGENVDCAGLLVFLRQLFGGKSYHEFNSGGLLGPHLSNEKLEAAIAKERGWVAAIKKSIIDGAETYADLLADADPTTALAAAYLLLNFAKRSTLAAELREHLKTVPSEIVQAGFVYCLGVCAEKDPKLQAFMRHLCTSSAPASVKSAAAIFVIRHQPDEPMPEAVQALTAALDGNGSAEIFEQFPWPANDIASHAVCTLTFLGEGARPLLARIGQAMRTAKPGISAQQIANSLLWIVFNRQPFPDDGGYESCTDDQKLALWCIEDSNGFWGPEGIVNTDILPLLKRWNLPRNRTNFRAFLAGKLHPKDEGWSEDFKLEGHTISASGADGRVVVAQLDIKVTPKNKSDKSAKAKNRKKQGDP